MFTLYELKNDYKMLLEMATDPDIDEEAWLESAYSIEGIIEDKMDSCAVVIDAMNNNISAIDAEIKRLQDRKEAINKRETKLKNYMMETIIAMDKPKPVIETAIRKISVVNNGGVLPMTVTGEVPNNYLKLKYEPDTEKIRKDLENGVYLEFAHLEERGKHLRIK